MHKVRQFRPSTVARRFPVVAGFSRPCVIDDVLEHSPAEHVDLSLSGFVTADVVASGHRTELIVVGWQDAPSQRFDI
jgi:hypothetical protein